MRRSCAHLHRQPACDGKANDPRADHTALHCCGHGGCQAMLHGCIDLFGGGTRISLGYVLHRAGCAFGDADGCSDRGADGEPDGAASRGSMCLRERGPRRGIYKPA